MTGAEGEFALIARLMRPLTRGAPEALGLLDDAAVMTARPGFDLIITKDAMVAGVHFLADEAPETIARRLLRTNLSDLAAKGAEPFGYLLGLAWPNETPVAFRERFAAGLALDGEAFDLRLLGGDTISKPGPLTVSATMLGYVPEGRMVKRAGASPGDVLLVSGTIGDGGLGLLAARGEIDDPSGRLAARYRLPDPRLNLRPVLRSYAKAAADISDGLLADAGHLATAGACGLTIDLEKMPISPEAARWLSDQPDLKAALVRLATAGDDYEIVIAVADDDVAAAQAAALADGTPLNAVGRFGPGQAVTVRYEGEGLTVAQRGFEHS